MIIVKISHLSCWLYVFFRRTLIVHNGIDDTMNFVSKEVCKLFYVSSTPNKDVFS